MTPEHLQQHLPYDKWKLMFIDIKSTRRKKLKKKLGKSNHIQQDDEYADPEFIRALEKTSSAELVGPIMNNNGTSLSQRASHPVNTNELSPPNANDDAEMDAESGGQ